MLGWCLVSFHFLWAILCPQAVLESRVKYIFALVAAGLYGHCPFVFVEDGRDGDGGGACHLNPSFLPSFVPKKHSRTSERETELKMVSTMRQKLREMRNGVGNKGRGDPKDGIKNERHFFADAPQRSGCGYPAWDYYNGNMLERRP